MFRSTKRRTAGRKNFESSIISASTPNAYLANVYNNSKLTFYTLPPVGEITLDEFETWAIDRIKILNEIESCAARNKSYKEIESIVAPMIQQTLPLNSTNVEKLNRERQKDYYSHFILRLCFSRSQELRTKFLKNETTLFKIRYNQLTNAEQQQFVKSLNLPWDFISLEEKEQLSTKLFNSISASLGYVLQLDDVQKRKYFEQEEFIKIPFEYVTDLLPQRSIFLQRGTAYVPKFQQLQLLVNEFSAKLEAALISTSHAFPSLDEDDRILPILTHLSSGYSLNYSQDSYGANENSSDINAITVGSKEIVDQFPLCGQHAMYGLRTLHHLKYTARQQFTLFLKGIGLSLEDALTFWSGEFKSVSIDKFNKEYKYNIRHSYGLEGGRINYKPWDCRTILSKPRPQKGEYHGCPYRDLSSDSLARKLREMGLEEKDVQQILEISDKGDYTNACSRVLEVKTNGHVQEQVTHPNLYFDRMRQYTKSQQTEA
ncbi:PRI2 [Cyberlindnera jadinii]|uniref:DNA primase large subunit n=1 Tax=Cyberlindnera jadinii (strain ATCC 18201 / CBS 1600 / BCRC 20928 / JCM 3617 / NBRC 0987 / NRRL Y-1542) TaxID=983966 RepID=A0A0H5C7L5_CYBJN|nr:PRI2 [Cyberlindnera jadinii]